MNTRLLVLLALAPLVGAIASRSAGRADEPKEPPKPTVIRKAGEYKLFDGKLVVTVTTKGDYVGYEIAKKPRGGSLARAPHPDNKVKKDSEWFILPLSVTEIWIFNGKDALDCLRFTPDGTEVEGGRCANDEEWAEYLKHVPAQAIAELPKRIQVLAPKK